MKSRKILAVHTTGWDWRYATAARYSPSARYRYLEDSDGFRLFATPEGVDEKSGRLHACPHLSGRTGLRQTDGRRPRQGQSLDRGARRRGTEEEGQGARLVEFLSQRERTRRR